MGAGLAVQVEPTAAAPLRVTRGKAEPPAAGARPSPASREVMRALAQRLMAEGFDYREAVGAFRAMLAATAFDQAGRSMERASARLGISRELLRTHKARAARLEL